MQAMKTSLALALLTIGCATDVFDDEPATTTSVQALEGTVKPGGDGNCPNWGCMSNSPVINGNTFHDVNEDYAVRNSANFSLLSLQKKTGTTWNDGVKNYKVKVDRGQLFALDWDSGAPAAGGVRVNGMRFVFVNHNTNPSSFYYVYIQDVGRMALWAQVPNTPTAYTYTYKLAWQYWQSSADPKPVCTPAPANAINMLGKTPLPTYYSVLFEGDRIDAGTIADTGEELGWFNIGCAGHTLAKTYLLGHTKASSLLLNRTTNLNQRTAMLKMLSADYCGNGMPFTVPGQPLIYGDEWGWYNMMGYADALEARWTERGATCLNVPRVDLEPTDAGIATFIDANHPSLESWLQDPQWCPHRPPPCAGEADLSPFDGAHLLTGGSY